jgi:hypothetical protein
MKTRQKRENQKNGFWRAAISTTQLKFPKSRFEKPGNATSLSAHPRGVCFACLVRVWHCFSSAVVSCFFHCSMSKRRNKTVTKTTPPPSRDFLVFIKHGAAQNAMTPAFRISISAEIPTLEQIRQAVHTWGGCWACDEWGVVDSGCVECERLRTCSEVPHPYRNLGVFLTLRSFATLATS